MKWLALLLVFLATPLFAADFSGDFKSPPPTARPWVYWFWNNGNVTKAGITADLEAMARVGVGGVIIMDVVERFAPPPGTADFMNPEWQSLFSFSVSEAGRLGLEINMTNGPGWCGSSGPWITPELSMQKLVITRTPITGPIQFSDMLPKPATADKRKKDVFDSSLQFADFYRDVAVLAYPDSAQGADPKSVVNLTAQMGNDGQLKWDVPAGKWMLARIGHISTGSSTRPPVKGGNGLECDKLSAAAMDLHFENMIGKLIKNIGPLAGPTLTATHIDSWEVGTQNWTEKFAEEFEKRRGYDPIIYLPNILESGKKPRNIVGDKAIADRFRWDFNQTVSELLAENYVGRLATLSHQHGLRLTIEGYNLPFGDEGTYTAPADEPMTEFWATGGSETLNKARQMASVAHVMGKAIVGAEAFTSDDHEQWKFTPATVKALGDYEFSQGVNRFVVHRYAHQPYLDKFPGATMGPWGLHYERTQTWWEMSSAWHTYLSRCQFMLRQGLYVADLLYLRPQQPDQGYFKPDPAVPTGYRYDECTAEELLTRVTVKDGRIVLPDGMSYRVLVLPAKSTMMTVPVVAKIKGLVAAGAIVYGPPPTASPSLSDYPKCDADVAAIAGELWPSGKVINGVPLEQLLDSLKLSADLTSTVKLNWIHRKLADSDVYFVANPAVTSVETECTFRVNGCLPERWNPESGEIESIAQYRETGGSTTIPLRFEPSGSAFIVFKRVTRKFDAVATFTRDGESITATPSVAGIKILSAAYGVTGDPTRTRDVQSKVARLTNKGNTSFEVARLAEGDDPAYGIVKTVSIEYTVNDRHYKITGQDPETIDLLSAVSDLQRPADLKCDASGAMSLIARKPGNYSITTTSGKNWHTDVGGITDPIAIDGEWNVTFPPNWGAPSAITLKSLASLSDSQTDGVKYFSGTAVYTKTFDFKPNEKSEYWLDLGDVQVMADVAVNGKDLGVLWKRPFRVNVSSALKAGSNSLSIRVANLWPNRMIGDSALPSEKRFTWSSYEPFKPNSPLPKSGLIGPVILSAEQSIKVE